MSANAGFSCNTDRSGGSDPQLVQGIRVYGAFANKAIDARLTAESTLTRIVEASTDKADRFTRAYIRGAQDYILALKDGRFGGPNAARVIDVLSRRTDLTDRELYKYIVPSGLSADGNVNAQSLRKVVLFFKEDGLISDPAIEVDAVLDRSFVDRALKSPGR
ncbi:MAG: transporter substrate-binding protein [Hyphomicrobiales bacterium]|nr:transporter substrate-binding protein [Hyphomicrobiales bacterium]